MGKVTFYTMGEDVPEDVFANEAEEYAQLAKDWAIKMDGAVEAGEFSSKYHAAAAASSAGDAATALAGAQAAADDLEAAAADAEVAARYAVPSTHTITSSAGVVTIDVMGFYTSHVLTLTENVTEWVFDNLPDSGKFRDHFVRIVQHASAAKTVLSPAWNIVTEDTTGKTAGGAWEASTTLSSEEVLGVRVFADGNVELYPGGPLA